MKRALLLLLAGAALVGFTACGHNRGSVLPHQGSCRAAPELCNGCPGGSGGPQMCQACGGRGCQACGQHVTPSPMTGAITYPYYTARGPRDYLAPNPPSIGP